LGERVCRDLAECAGTMAAQRQRVYRRIQELSAGAGGETGEAAGYLESVFTRPEQLLGGPGAAELDDE
jgi:hypothetical protein